MMRPQPRSTMPSNTGLVMLNTLSRLVRSHRVPVRLVHLPERHVARDAGVVDEHVDRARPPTRSSPRPSGTIRSRRRRPAPRAKSWPCFFISASHSCGFLVAGRVGRDDFVAHAGKLEADRFAQTAHAAGHHRHSLVPCRLLRKIADRVARAVRRASVPSGARSPSRSGPAPARSRGSCALPGAARAGTRSPPCGASHALQCVHQLPGCDCAPASQRSGSLSSYRRQPVVARGCARPG